MVIFVFKEKIEIHKQPSQFEVAIPQPKYDHYLFKTGSLQISSLDGNDPNILSQKQTVGIFSFIPLNETKPVEHPPPVYCKFEELLKIRGVTKADVLAGTDKTSGGELKCVDKAVLDSQKGNRSILEKT